MNTLLKALIIAAFGICAANASASDLITGYPTLQFGSTPSINPQPLPPRTDPPVTDFRKPKFVLPVGADTTAI